jgi:RHS repeat-associated protein
LYDNAGNRTSKTNYLDNSLDSYTYDNIYQLTQVTEAVNGNPASTTESYSYDLGGNRLSSLNVASYTYDSSNHLNSSSDGVTYTYDNNGNTATKVDASGTTTYTWNNLNQLTSVALPGTGGTVTFKYDPFGRRIQKVSPMSGSTNYLYDGANSVQDVNASGNTVARYAQGLGIDQPLAMLRGGASSFYQADGLGSITGLGDGSGNVATTYKYDLFGKLSASTGTLVNPFQYTGRDYDPETGLRYYRARYYDSVIGRFISEDPIRFRGGIDFYAYTGNGPVTFIDPTGLKKCKDLPCDPNKLRLVPIYVQEGNHEINYSLMTVDGKPAPGQWYVFEHQTQSGGGRPKYGPKDYVSPIHNPEWNGFQDILTVGLDTVQTFTISADSDYDPACQHKVIIRYGNGQDYGSQHIWQPGGFGPVMINNYSTLPVMP